MTEFEHTFLAVACIALAFYFGRYIGRMFGYMDAFEDGVHSATTAILVQLQKQYGLDLKASIEVEENEED